MAAQRSRWLFLSLSLVLILYIRDLLGQTSDRVVEGTTQTHSVQVVTYFSRHGRLVACSKMTFVIERDMSFSVSRFSKEDHNVWGRKFRGVVDWIVRTFL